MSDVTVSKPALAPYNRTPCRLSTELPNLLRVNSIAMSIFVVVVLAAGCISENNPDAGTITLSNESSHPIAWVRGYEIETLDDALARAHLHVLLQPGHESRSAYDLGLNVEDWCEPPGAMHWIALPREETEWNPRGIQLSADDVEILEVIGPGHCWSERDASYQFNG